jgi:hypothetical protein
VSGPDLRRADWRTTVGLRLTEEARSVVRSRFMLLFDWRRWAVCRLSEPFGLVNTAPDLQVSETSHTKSHSGIDSKGAIWCVPSGVLHLVCSIWCVFHLVCTKVDIAEFAS